MSIKNVLKAKLGRVGLGCDPHTDVKGFLRGPNEFCLSETFGKDE